MMPLLSKSANLIEEQTMPANYTRCGLGAWPGGMAWGRGLGAWPGGVAWEFAIDPFLLKQCSVPTMCESHALSV